ncbi:gliding motility lipoprotein GldD [Lacihabitans sp. LS3-19]|uniref:gliding motility lipoprotein GldD n=1 Tax=Lacihabitans sp. LS3-19 TaxID=2487335 RepID=UPI0020CEE948|nr:gliding motility lipoprotein GldD [Lacihabitans sp. LS3-19]MCP9767355.1 gliding motility lipoprotein GldD [Lacihabitans sp. LS3-19]
MKVFFLLFIGVITYSCGGSTAVYYPKPKGYERIDLPEHRYQTLEGSYPYTFEYSESAVITPDKSKDAEPNWILVEYPKLNAKVQFTYKPLYGDLQKLDKHVADAYKLASKHQVRATSQKEQVIKLENGKSVVVIELEGEVPSHYQFYATDTSKHFLRGAVYLNSATFGDSLRPIVDFLKIDSRHILETLKWKN